MNHHQKLSRVTLVILLTILIHLLILIALFVAIYQPNNDAEQKNSNTEQYIFFKQETPETTMESPQVKQDTYPQTQALQHAQALPAPEDVHPPQPKPTPPVPPEEQMQQQQPQESAPTALTNFLPRPKTEHAPQQQKPRMTLADVSNGFFKSVIREQQVQEGVTTNNQQSLGHQFSMNRYQQKVIDTILQSSRANKKKLLWDNEMCGARACQAWVTIDRAGKILTIKIDPTTGVERLDQALIETFNDVGWYPPLPKGYQGETYTFSLPIARPEKFTSGVIHTVHLIRGS